MLNRIPGKVARPSLNSGQALLRPAAPLFARRQVSGLAMPSASQLVARRQVSSLTVRQGGPDQLNRYFPGYTDMPEMTTPGNPPANVARMYCRDDAGNTKLYFRDSGGTETVMAGGGGSGAFVLIQSQVASASAQLDFETSIDDTYDAFDMRFSSLVPATDDVGLILQVKQGGTYQTTGYVSGITGITGAAATVTGSGTSGIMLSRAAGGGTGVGNASGESISGTARFHNPEITTLFMNFEVSATHRRAAGDTTDALMGGGIYGTAGAITGIRVKFTSGNIASGRVSLYGLTKS